MFEYEYRCHTEWPVVDDYVDYSCQFTWSTPCASKKCYRIIKTITDRVQSAQCSTIVFLIVKRGNVFQRWFQDDWHECVLHLRIGPRTGHYLTWYPRPSFKKGEYYIGMGIWPSVSLHYQRSLWLKLDHFYLTMRLTILIPLLSVVNGDAFNECP